MLHWFGKRLREMQEVKRDERGFTLIELLVVIIIIGILAAIAIPTFLAQRDTARQSSQESDMRNLAAAATACSANNNGAYVSAGPPAVTCNAATLAAAPYNFNGTQGVTCTTGAITATNWQGSCRHGDLPTGQSASFNTDNGRVTQVGY